MVVHSLAVLALTTGLLTQVSRPSAARVDCDRPAYECATLLIEGGNFDAAIARLRQALTSTPRDLKLLNLLGIALTGAGRTEEANSSFREALALDADFQPARKNLAVNEFNKGRLAPAERLFNEVLARVPVTTSPISTSARFTTRANSRPWRCRTTKRAASASRPTPVLVTHYASCLLDQGDRAKAVSVLDQLPAGDGASHFEAGVRLGRAAAHADAARHFGAARSTYKDPYSAGYEDSCWWKRAITKEPFARRTSCFVRTSKSGELYNLVSRAYVASSRIQDAYDALRTAAKLEPSEEQHYLDLALICLDLVFDLGVEIVDVGLQ